MNHPSREEWMSLLYGELDLSAAQALRSHADGCPECAEQVAVWASARAALGSWKLPLRKPSASILPMRTWAWPAAAAAAALMAGLLLGWSEARRGADRERQAAERSLSQLREELSTSIATLRGELQDQLDQGRQDDAAALGLVVAELEERNVAQLARIRHDFETIARNTVATFEIASERLSQLSDLNGSTPETP